MTFLPGTGVRVLVNKDTVSANIAGVTIAHQRPVSDVTSVLSGGGMNFVPGLMSGTMTLRGPYDSDANLQVAIRAAMGVDNSMLITACPDGLAIGKPALFILGDPTDYATDAAVADALGFTVGAQADESADMGYIVHAWAAETASANGTSVDRGAAPATPTTGGLAAALHCTVYSGFTNVSVKVQHSTDNSTWADLVTFTTFTNTASERKTLAKGTTVNRYLRTVTTVTGTGSATFLVAVAPR